MKTQKVLIIVGLVFVVTGIFTECKKNNDQEKTCRLTAANYPWTNVVYRLSYNSNGKLNTVTIGDTVTTYTYSGNTTIAASFKSGTFIRKNIITLNTAGMAANIRTEIDLTGNNWHNKAYEYNGVELIKSTLTFSTGTSSSVTTYTWSNGNMVSVTSGTVTNILDYYPDKLNQGGAAFNQSPFLVYQFIQGYEIYRTKNLLKSINGETFAYDFRPDGNISSVRAISGNANDTIVKYKYQCESN